MKYKIIKISYKYNAPTLEVVKKVDDFVVSLILDEGN